MFVRCPLVMVALVLGSTSIVACARASAIPGTPIETPLVSPTRVVGPPTPTLAVLASSTPTAGPPTDTPVSPVSPTPAAPTPSSTVRPEANLGEASPTGAATAEPGGSIRVTQADNGRTINLHVGQTLLLALGNNLDWTVTVADPAVVRRVVNVLVVRGAQGIYRANQVGQTSLTATGRPICAPNQACPMFIQVVKVDLVVR